MIPEQLREARLERGWTLEEAGKRLGCTYAHVSQIERGKMPLTEEMQSRLDRLYSETGASLEDALYYEPEMEEA